MKPWKAKAFLILAGIICGLILCEAGLRFLGIEYPSFYDYDPQFGGKLRAGMEGYWLKEGGGYVSGLLPENWTIQNERILLR